MKANPPHLSTKFRQVHYAMIGVILAVLLIGFNGNRPAAPTSDAAAATKVSFLIVMKSQVDTSSLSTIHDFNARKQAVYSALIDHANKTQAPIRTLLDSRGLKYRAYYLTSALAVNADTDVRTEMNARSDVAYTLELPNLQPLEAVATDAPLAFEPTGQLPDGVPADIEPVYPVPEMDAQEVQANIWGVPYIGAPKVWQDYHDVYSAFPNGKYSTAAGTSMAAPHVAGLVALMWSANPDLRGDVEGTMSIIRGSAKNVTITDREACGGSTGVPNNVYGHGYASAFEAVQEAMEYK